MYDIGSNGEIPKSLADEPDGFKKWRKHQGKAGKAETGEPAEAIVKGAFAADSKANKRAQKKSSKPKRRWLRRRS